MALTSEDYLAQLQALCPKGKAWPVEDPESTFYSLLYAIADEWGRLDHRIDDLLNEMDPRTTYELLEDWERVLGLPDTCTGLGATLQERRLAASEKLSKKGGQSRQYFIDLAGSYGYSITIDEFDTFRVDSGCIDDELADESIRFYWQVNAEEAPPITYFRTGESSVDEPLEAFNSGLLECLMRKYKPAHTTVIFNYSS